MKVNLKTYLPPKFLCKKRSISKEGIDKKNPFAPENIKAFLSK
jgi:hypothetical protein